VTADPKSVAKVDPVASAVNPCEVGLTVNTTVELSTMLVVLSQIFKVISLLDPVVISRLPEVIGNVISASVIVTVPVVI